MSSNNGLRLIHFAAAGNMVIGSNLVGMVVTRLFPDQNTRNQIGHVLIDGRHASSILDVCTIRGADIDSDLVVAKVRTRISPVKKSVASTCRKFVI